MVKQCQINQFTGTATKPQRNRKCCQFNKDQYCNKNMLIPELWPLCITLSFVILFPRIKGHSKTTEAIDRTKKEMQIFIFCT